MCSELARLQAGVKIDGIGDNKGSQFLSRELNGVIALGGESNLLTIAPTAVSRMHSCIIPILQMR